MPRMLVITESADQVPTEVMLNEHLATDDLASDHFAAQLVERIAWALADAEQAEHRLVDRHGSPDSNGGVHRLSRLAQRRING